MSDIKETLEALNKWGKENLGKVDQEIEARFWAEVYSLRHQLAGLERAI